MARAGARVTAVLLAGLAAGACASAPPARPRLCPLFNAMPDGCALVADHGQGESR